MTTTNELYKQACEILADEERGYRSLLLADVEKDSIKTLLSWKSSRVIALEDFICTLFEVSEDELREAVYEATWEEVA